MQKNSGAVLSLNHLIHYTAADSKASRSTPPASQAQQAEKARQLTVGIPQLVQGARFLERMLTHLGCSVVLSGPTTRHTLEVGARLCGPDAPLPLRALAGQAISLRGRADWVIAEPVAGRSLGHELVGAACSLVELPQAAVLRGDWSRLDCLSDTLGLDPQAIRAAYLQTLAAARNKEMELAALTPKAPAVALLGHPYLTFDSYLNQGVKRALKAKGYACAVPGGSASSFGCGRLCGAIHLEAHGCDYSPYERVLLHHPNSASVGLPTLTIHLESPETEQLLQTSLDHFLQGINALQK